jgi:hypothetical protein
VFRFSSASVPSVASCKKDRFPNPFNRGSQDTTDARSDLFYHKETKTQRAERSLNSALSVSSCKKDWDRSALPVSVFQLFSICLSPFPPLPPVRKIGFQILLTADLRIPRMPDPIYVTTKTLRHKGRNGA